MPTITRSHVTRRGRAYYKVTGRYNEFTQGAMREIINNASPASRQTKLAKKGKNSAAAKTVTKAFAKLGVLL